MPSLYDAHNCDVKSKIGRLPLIGGLCYRSTMETVSCNKGTFLQLHFHFFGEIKKVMYPGLNFILFFSNNICKQMRSNWWKLMSCKNIVKITLQCSITKVDFKVRLHCIPNKKDTLTDFILLLSPLQIK